MLSAAPTHAQDGPSYNEALAFLRSKVDLNYGNTKTIRLIENKKCNFTQKTTLLPGSDGSPVEQTFLQTFELSDFDPSKIEYRKSTNPGFPNDGLVTAATKELKKAVRFESTSYFQSKPSSKSWKRIGSNLYRSVYQREDVTFHTLQPNHDNGPRVVRALQHLVKLCGGKEELF